MRISTVANWLAALCALVASVVCYQLVLRHVTGLSGPAWFELECSDKPGSAAAGCTEVLASPYSYFPPKHDKNVPAGLPHIGYFCPTPQKGKIRGISDRLVALRDRVSGAEAELL
jgi:hypothetical protein